jgi:hypothetical protein
MVDENISTGWVRKNQKWGFSFLCILCINRDDCVSGFLCSVLPSNPVCPGFKIFPRSSDYLPPTLKRPSYVVASVTKILQFVVKVWQRLIDAINDSLKFHSLLRNTKHITFELTLCFCFNLGLSNGPTGVEIPLAPRLE